MLGYLMILMGLAGAVNVEGHTNRAIQAAVDRAAAQGGGEVRIPAGTYDMEDSLHLRSHVKIRGEGEKTILRKLPSVASPLSADLGYGHYDVSLAEPDKFHIGMGIHIHDNRSGGFYDTVASLTWREGDRFGLSRMLNHDYGRRASAVATSIFPVISGCHLEGAAVEDLAIDGNKEQNAYLNGCRGGGVFLLQAHNVVLKRLRVRNYNGDGISFQQCRNTLVEDCRLEGMAGLGLHPGSGSVAPVMRGNVCRDNGSDGIFYCLRVSFSLCENNTIENNGGYGISIGGRDTDQWIRRNTIRHNAKAGIFFREGDLAMAGSRNRIEENLIEDNCRRQGPAEIEIQGETRDVQIVKNTIRPGSRQGKPANGIRIGAKADRIVIFDNRIEGDKVTAVENQAPPSAVSTLAPAKPLAVGPEGMPKTGAAHLGPQVR
jgi:polygalacturonase